MIDSEGFRHNVGIILSNHEGRLLWARRIGQNAWQFPQGGIKEQESPEEALYRELQEEVGLGQDDVQVIGYTREWLSYRLPRNRIRYHSLPLCIGQKQRWYMLRLLADDEEVRLDRSDSPEFDYWRWVDYWFPLHEVVSFKRKVYERALKELAPLLFPDGVPRRRRRGPRGFRR